MKLIINGNEKIYEINTLVELLKKLNIDENSVAVEINKEIIHRQTFSTHKLNENDKIEIINAVGGG